MQKTKSLLTFNSSMLITFNRSMLTTTNSQNFSIKYILAIPNSVIIHHESIMFLNLPSTCSCFLVLFLFCFSLGGSFAYLRVELGDFVAFIAAGNILLEYVISCAAVARSWTSYFATLCNKNPDDFRIVIHNMNSNYSHLDPIAVLVLVLVCILAVRSTKGSSIFNYIASVVHIIIIVFIVITGLIHAKPQNYVPFAPFGVRGVFQASAVLYFAYVGFDAVATMAEETKNPSRDIPIGLVGSMLIATLAYCLLAATLCLMQPYTNIDVNAPFSVAFSAIGWDWAKYIVSLGALKGMTTVLLVTAVGQARYLTHISRTHMMPPWFAFVDEHTGTPVNATIFLVLISALIGFFTDLEVLSNLLSISTLFIFMLVAVALLVRRYYSSGVTTKSNQIKLIVFIVVIIGSSCGISSYWAVSDGWIGYAVFCPIWVLATGGLWLLVPKAKEPKLWGVPLVPWLPSISIFINIFLLGSIDKDSFIRFAFWTVLLLVYYVLLGLHASYDKAKEFEAQSSAQRGVNTLEDGVVVSST